MKTTIPSKRQCYNFLVQMDMPEHIISHSVQVCRVATFLLEELKKTGVRLNLELVQASALLHDITKPRSFQTGENHAETGETYLSEMGYPEVGYIVGQHIRLDDYFETSHPTEAEIINYADKRVLHDRIVSLSRRMEYILERYGHNEKIRKRIQWLAGKTFELEERIFHRLPIEPDDLIDRFDPRICKHHFVHSSGECIHCVTKQP